METPQRRRRHDGPRPTARHPDYRQLRHPFAPQPVFSDDRVAAMHEAALAVLENHGIKVLLPEAVALYARAGARVDGDMVRLGRDIVADALALAPGSIRLHAANPARTLTLEPGALTFMAGGGAPNCTDLRRGRRPGTQADYEEQLKLVQGFDAIHYTGPTVESQDIDPALRHLAVTRAQLTLTDKVPFVYARGTAQAEDAFAMIAQARGLTDLTGDARCYTVINSNSPRQLDVPMSQGLIDFARWGQPSIVTPFCLMGAMAPITVAGALVLQHAEALAGITLAQLARAGAPVLYGSFASNVDMKSGAPAFGTPAHLQATLGAGQLARHIGLPWRSGAGSAGNSADAQAAQEAVMGLWGSMLAQSTMIVHSAGWLEGGLTFGYEKFIIDMEAVQTLAELCTRPPQRDADFALDAIAEVPPGGHFFAAAHTMARYDSAFYEPLVADLRNHGQWMDGGAPLTQDRALAVWQQRLADYRIPDACAGIDAVLAPFIERRTREGGAPPLG